jgi:hypothetical protein
MASADWTIGNWKKLQNRRSQIHNETKRKKDADRIENRNIQLAVNLL